MSLWGAIGGWIGSVFGGLARTPLQSVADAQMAGGSYRHTFDSTLRDYDLIKETAATCLHARASERSVLRFTVTYGGSTNNEIAFNLQSLLDNPSPIISRTEFLELASQCFDADGNVAILLIPDDKGFPAEQWLLPSSSFAPRFASTDDPVPIGYMWNDGRTIHKAENLVLLRRMSVEAGPYKGRGVLSEAETSLRIQDQLSCAQLNSIQRGGKPDIAIEFPVGVLVTPEQASAYQKLWHDKFSAVNGTNSIGFIPDGGKAVPLALSELTYPSSRAQNSAALRESFQTPRILLGDTDNVNHNNGQTAIAIFERTVVLRFGQALASAYEFTFRKNFGSAVSVEVAPMVIQSFTALSQSNALHTVADENA